MEEKMLCPNCGKELPAESQFCPYCMTKFGEEKEIDASGFEPKKSVKKAVAIISAIVCAAVIIAAVAVPKFRSDEAQGSNTANNISNSSSTISQSTKQTEPEPSAQHVVVLTDNSPGFSSGAYAASNPAARLFDSGFVSVPYDTLVINEKAYGGAKIKFDCVVLKVEGNTVFAEYGASKGFDGIYHSTGDYAALIFSQSVRDIAYGDSLVCFGTFVGNDSYSISGESHNMPSIKIQSCTDFVYTSVLSPVFTQDEITAAAQSIFGKNTSVRESVKSDFADSSVADIIMDGGLFYTAETGDSKYCFYAGEGSFIYDCGSVWPEEKYILPAVNAEYIFTYTVNKSNKAYTLECSDQNSNKLWHREFDNAYSAVMDYTSDYIYLVANTSLYVIDVKTGKDAVKPQYVGNKCKIVKLENSLLLVSPSRTDAVMKTDLEGNVIWTTDLAYDMPNADTDAPPCVQTVDSGYLISYEAQENGYSLGTYSAMLSPNGEIEFEEKIF